MVATEAGYFDNAHNKIVEEMATKGLLGIISYMLLWNYVAWVIVSMVQTQRSRGQAFTLLVGGALTGYFVQNLFLFDTPGTVTSFYLLFGYVVYLETRMEKADFDTSTGSEVRPISRLARAGGTLVRKSGASTPIALVVIGALVLLAIYALNYRAYDAARTLLDANNTDLGWEKRVEVLDKGIDAFPPLANDPRVMMFNGLTRNLHRMSDQEVMAAVATVDREGRDALKSEPRQFRIYVSLASFYQNVARDRPIYIEQAKFHVDKAKELAPERIETQQLLTIQQLLERSLEGPTR